MPAKTEHIKYILEGEDRASSVFKKVASNVQGTGKAILGAAGVAGTALAGLGAGLVSLAEHSEPLIGVKKAFNDLTADVEGGSAAMLKSLQESSRGWVTNADLMMSFNQASSLVGDDFARNLPEAMQYLTKVAASTGMDMNYMLDSLVRGVGRMSPLILDNLGIQVDLTQATDRAAEMFGKEADELSKAEQQAGMMNVIMEKLKINTAKMELPEKSFASFKVTLENLRHELGEKLVPLLSPFVDKLAELAKVVGEWLARALEKIAPLFERVGKVLEWLLAFVKDKGIEELFIRFEDGSTIMERFFEKLGMGEAKARKLAHGIIDIKEGIQEWIGRIRELIGKVKEFLEPVTDWIKKNVEIKDVLIALAIAVGSVVVPALVGLLLTVGQIVLPLLALIGIIALVRKAWESDWLGIRTKLTEAWETKIRPALEKLGEWLKEKIPEAIEKLKEFWDGTLRPALERGGEALKKVRDKVRDVVGAIKWLVERIKSWGIGALFETFEDGSSVLDGFFKKLGMAEGPARKLAGAFRKIREVVVKVWTVLKALFGAIVQTIKPTVEKFLGGLKDSFKSFQPLGERFKQLWEALQPVIKVVAGVIGGALLVALGLIVGVINGVIEALDPFIRTLGLVLDGVIQVLTGIVNTVVNFFKLIYGLVTGNSDLIKEAWEGLKEGLKGIVLGLVQAIVGLFRGLWETLKALVGGIVQGVIDFFVNLVKQLVGGSIIPDMVNKIVDYFKQLWAKVIDWVKQLKDKVIEFFKELADKVQTKVQELKDKVSELWQKLRDKVKEIALAIYTYVRERFIALKNKVREAVEGLRQKVIEVWEALKTKLGGILDTVKEKLNRFKGVIDSVRSALQRVWTWIGNVASKLLSIVLPDWLTGHSPSPFENTLAGISAGLSQVNADLFETQRRFQMLGRTSIGPTVAATFAQPPAYVSAPGRLLSDRHYNLTIVTSGDPGRLAEEFGLMETWAGA